jgi:hypothetical protein
VVVPVISSGVGSLIVAQMVLVQPLASVIVTQ